MAEDNLIKMSNITKIFGDNIANNKINLEIRKGEVHSLLGENGAGKSTLMNILYGLYTADEGEIFLDGKKVVINSPLDAINHKIAMVHQHFMLVDVFTVTENIILGNEPTKGMFLDKNTAKDTIKELIDRYGLNVDPDAKVMNISVGMQQRVEILKALYRGSDIIIFDEPTAVLTPQEIEDFIGIVNNLKAEGKTIIIITHKLREIKSMADRCTIIRRGKKIDTVNVCDVTEQDLANMMVGREVVFAVDKPEVEVGEVCLKVENLKVDDLDKRERVRGLNLELRKGQILGLAGVDGNGQIELVDAIIGMTTAKEGKIFINGKEVQNKSPKDIIDSKLLSIPEDRQKHGLILEYPVDYNLSILRIKNEPLSKKGILQEDKLSERGQELIENFDIRPTDGSVPAGSLSGGNQQKVIIARQITEDPDILIAVTPTRGLDVGAIEYVHRAIVNERNKGKAILLVSFELDEILNLSDEIAVIFDGKIVDQKKASETNENELGLLMAGGKNE
ncbi:ABC transporter ATP-binding protein [Ezakiella peruensis]|uniref:ABC transporter ATP-binding protein n=1 Tax=Ezakiella peruensis TaxID=1464038 RepID=UPI000C1B4AB4|nr:ABC transporter ATP-binding protein [Ezakiella peruensis]